MNLKTLALVFSSALALGVFATDYYVGGDNASDDNEGSVTAPFATIDKALTAGGGTEGNNIYLAAGEYETNQQWGYDLKANLIGAGATRDDVVIKSAGTYRTLRMNSSGPTVTNLTIVGESTQKADKGGAIEMNGGTLVDCVIRDGSVKNGSSNDEGGNLYISNDNALVLNCEIRNGQATKRGGNVYLDKGTVRNCTISGGTSANVGGNVYQYSGKMEGCTITGGTATNDGGNVRMNGGGTLSDSVVQDGTVTTQDKKGANVYMDSSAKLIRCHLKGGVNPNYNAGSLCVYSSSAAVEDCLVEGSTCGGVLMGGTSYLYNVTVVNNAKYGVWSWTETQHLYNCIVFGNTGDDGVALNEWTGNLPNASGAHFMNCATSETGTRLLQSAFPTLVYATSDDFVDFVNGDYRPSEGGVLVDAGCDDPRGAAASSTDLKGAPRTSGTVDIGCYEYQKQDMTVRLESGEYAQVWAPTTVTFTHVVEHSVSPENVVVTYDFGDGSEPVSTKASSVAHDYTKAGVYTVKLTATNECEEESAEMTYRGYVRVASSTVYVKAGNAAAAYPYDTPETAYANLKTACNEAYDGYTIKVGAGAYEWGDQLSITKALRIVGTEEDVAKVVFRNTNLEPNTYYYRTVELNNAEAFLANVTIENGCVKNQYGGNLRIAGGACVSNCVIRGGLAVADNGNAAGAGVVLSGQNSTITHCTITGNTVRGTSNDQNYAGGAVFIEYSAKNIHLSNLLIAGNTYEATDATKRGTAGVRYGGGNDWTTMENCTIVGNTVTGAALPDNSAAVYCTSWHVLFYNNIFVGNVETEKEGGKATSVKFIDDAGSNYKYMSNITDDALIEGSTTKSIGNQVVSGPAVLFRNFPAGNYTLKPSCPACNKGTTSGLALTPSVDLMGQPRVFGKTVDVGCYEAQVAGATFIVFR